MGKPNKLYFCDPSKNTGCPKTGCFIKGGECCRTSNPEFKGTALKVPKIEWIPFDKNNLPKFLVHYEEYLVLIREDDHDNGGTWTYSVDLATPYGNYISNFWDTEVDWKEGQEVEVVAYAAVPYSVEEDKLVEVEA